MPEYWLYEKTLSEIQSLHNLHLHKILRARGKIQLPALAHTGTSKIEIDIIAHDPVKKVLVLSECKEFLTLQGASECAEQLSMKTYLLQRYPPSSPLGRNGFNFTGLHGYHVLHYVALGSYTGRNYKNAQCCTEAELIKRLDFYSAYLDRMNKSHIGIMLFFNKDARPVVKQGILKVWDDIA